MKYYVKLDEYTYTITEPDPDDDWDSGESGLEYTFKSISLSEPKGDYGYRIIDTENNYQAIYGVDSNISVGEQAYVVVVKYTDGDTFGSSEYTTIVAIKKDINDAYEVVKKVNNNNDTDVTYRPWDGYFAHLNSVEVEIGVLRP